MEAIRQSLGALEAHDGVRALELLIEAWRARRDEHLAEAIDLVSAAVAAAVPSLGAQRSQSAAQDAWLDLCQLGHPESLPMLLRTFRSPRSPYNRARLDRLERHHAPDPRLVPFLLEALGPDSYRVVGTHGADLGPTNTMALRMLAASWDARRRPDLEALVQQLPSPHPKLRALLAAPAPAPSAELRALPATVREHARRLALVGPPVRRQPPTGPARVPTAAPTEDVLLAAVYAAPDDPAPRLVYGDWCSERGLPRGELIALQHKPSPTARDLSRARALVKAHVVEWLGPIERVIVPKSVRFEGGFLAACATRFGNRAQRDELAAHPAWSTARELTTDDATVVATARAVRSLFEVRQPLMMKLCAGPPVSVESLSFANATLSQPAALGQALASTSALPRLRRSAVRLDGAVRGPLSPASVPWLFESGAFVERLEHIHIVQTLVDHPIAIGAFVERLPAATTELRCDVGRFAVVLARRAGSLHVTVLVRPTTTDAALRALATVDPRTVASVTVQTAETFDDARREAWTRAVERFAVASVAEHVVEPPAAA